MALGQFGSLTYSAKDTYNYSISKDFAMDTLLKNIGKAKFASNPIASENSQPALENLKKNGGVEVLS